MLRMLISSSAGRVTSHPSSVEDPVLTFSKVKVLRKPPLIQLLQITVADRAVRCCSSAFLHIDVNHPDWFWFPQGHWREVEPNDKYLRQYVDWIRQSDGLGLGATRDPIPIPRDTGCLSPGANAPSKCKDT